MKVVSGFLIGVLAMVAFSGAAYAGTAGVFRLPFDPNQHWSDCGQIGYKKPADQIFMNLNIDLSVPKYHMAEDWNGVCGRSTDLGAVLYAIADGVVQDANMTLSQGGFLLIRHPLPDGITNRYILYEHIQSIEVNPRTGVQFAINDVVYIGDTIARLGDGNGYYATQEHCGVNYPCAHLHFEMRRSLFSNLDTNPYYPTLSISDALKYSSPSLFIDDRRYPFVQNLSKSTYDWNYFSQYLNAPSSTAFIEYNGERYSLKRAVQLGYIYQYVYEQRSGTWYYYPDITNVFFNAGSTYAVWSFVNGVALTILVPGDHFRDDRTKIDMLQRAASDARWSNIKTEIYDQYKDLSWDPAWELRGVSFGFNGGTNVMYHATNKTNPLIRFVGFNDPATGSWNGWTQVNPNTLD